MFDFGLSQFFKGNGAVDSSFICIQNTSAKYFLLSIRVANPVVFKCPKNEKLKTEDQLFFVIPQKLSADLY
jgi:hypothetical protein